jgi:hypothetical protein
MKAFSAIICLAILLAAMPARAQESMPPMPEASVNTAPALTPAKPESTNPRDKYMQGLITYCGAPVHTDINTTKIENVCDYYTRQIAYWDEQKHLKDQLLERQKNFDAPAREARANYKKNLEAHWSRMGAAKTGGNP